uniref:NACHT domain-containing protein n=1 Tax=Candidatus Electrothrix sp. TaxID=2170559 RepID=UPI0040571175
MSRAGAKSDQGDDYQRFIALHWIIRLISDDEIEFVQAQSTGLPDVDEKITVDDIVVCYRDGRRRHSQAKKNQSANRCWNLTDLKDELPKIQAQLESSPKTLVALYSRTPFGEFTSLVEAGREYPDFAAFKHETGKNLQDALVSLATCWDLPLSDTFALLRRIEIGPHHSFEDWPRINLEELQRLVSRADTALEVLESFLNTHQSKLLASSFVITREDVLDLLRKHGCVRAPLYEESEILEQFLRISAIGRKDWQRTVGGRKINRSEFDQILEQVKEGATTVLITDRPGSGKTCLLLDLADHIEKDDRYGLLFIKGDRFTTESSTADLPEDIPGLCARLAEKRRVVVILDSLDVLSMNREHDRLEMFLRLLDQLQPIPGVTVTAACRSFDLKYDTLLRDRKWSKEVKLADFDYEQIVAPLLKDWNVAEHEIDAPLQELLRLPQNLRLFETVARHGGPYNIRSVHELHDAYLAEAILKSPLLDESAVQILRDLADKLLREREQWIAPAFFPLTEELRRALISCGVLHQDEQGKIGFGHQTLLDNLAAKSAFHRGQTLADFITSHPPFPFIRPAVRSFVFHLRAYSAKKFRQQIRSALSDPNVAYHFKRLLAESLIEITPDADDRSFINRLMRQEPELFRRFFWRLNSDAWFSWLTELWLPNLGSVQEDGEWYALFASKLGQWQNVFPEEVLALWQRAFAEQWDEKNNLVWRAVSSLDKFQHWHVSGIDSLLKLLLDESSDDTHFLGKAISQYVAATGQGDDLLWRFIIKDLNSKDMTKWNIGQKLHCDDHDFHKKNFFEQRILASEYLLDLVLNDLQIWADAGISDYDRKRGRRPYSVFLSDTSWTQTHHQLDHRHADDFTILLYIVELVLKHHSRGNTAWWQTNEPQLRQSWEESIIYLLLLAYHENLEANIAGITVLLSDKNMLRYGRLEHELGELASTSFHLLNESGQDLFQRTVLSLYDDEDWGNEQWVQQQKYDYLVWIPAIFRLPEAQHLIDQLTPPLGSPLPLPQIYLSSIDYGPLIPLEQLLQLSDTQLYRLLSYFDILSANEASSRIGKETNKHEMHTRIRRWTRIEQVLSEAAGYDPLRYFALLQEFKIQKLNTGYSIGILQGIANHLRYRFGNLNPPDKKWKHVEPPPDDLALAEILIKSAEQFAPLWQDGYAISHIIEACCEVIEDTASAERLVFLLFRLCKHPDPEKIEQRIVRQDKKEITSYDLQHDAINRVRGVAAGAAMTLCNRLLEKEIELPKLLFPLLRRYALDHVQSVRAALMNGLPFLTHKHHAWGWQLFDDIFRDAPTLLWPLAERHLYHQYHNHFDKVAPCLDRIQQEAPAEASEAWGRIATLASLDGHLPQDSLFAQLEKANQPKQWKGAAQVFAANIERHNDACMKGLRRILERETIDKETLSAVSDAFNLEKNGKVLDADFAVLFIRKIQVDSNRFHYSQLFDWIAWLAQKDAEASINVFECLLEKLEGRKENINQLYDTKALLSALTSILREADESEDELMINQAVRLQDQFLRMGLHGMEDFLEQVAIL